MASNVTDIQEVIEVALGGRVMTHTVEKRDRFPGAHPLRPAYREDEEAVRRLLVSSSMSDAANDPSRRRSQSAAPGGCPQRRRCRFP